MQQLVRFKQCQMQNQRGKSNWGRILEFQAAWNLVYKNSLIGLIK